jgi:hypothetical protein
MAFQHWRIAILLPLLLTCACSTVPIHVPVPPDVPGKISSTDVVVPIAQSEIYVYVPPSNAGAATGGGLLGALIDVAVNDARTSHAEDAVKAVRDSLVDFDFDGEFKADLQPALAQVAWLHPNAARVVKDVASNDLDKILDASQASAVLFAIADYHLSNDGDVLFVTLTAGLFPRSDALQAGTPGASPKTAWANALYRNTFTFETKAPGATGDRDHDVIAWSADKGAPIRAALQEGMVKLPQMLAADFQGNYANATGNKVTVDDVVGQAIQTDSDGSIVRFDDGTLKFAARSVIQ